VTVRLPPGSPLGSGRLVSTDSWVAQDKLDFNDPELDNPDSVVEYDELDKVEDLKPRKRA
jgi:hypothetical protein